MKIIFGIKINQVLFYSSVLVLFLSLLSGYVQADDLDKPSKIEISDKEGNRIVYEGRKVIDGLDGVISIFSKKNELLRTRNGLPPPACVGSDYASPKLLPKNPESESEIIVVCGDYGAGNHITLSFIENANFIGSVEVGSNGSPKLLFNKAFGTYQTFGMNRLSSQFQGLDTFFIVYEWNGRNSWFQPTFNKHSTNAYLSNYQLNKKYLIDKVKRNGRNWKDVIADSTLASLIATIDKEFICSELEKLPFSQFPKKDIQSTISFNEHYGYPSFNISICGEK